VSSRRLRRGRRFLGAGLVVLVVAGGAGGYLLTGSSGGRAEQVQYTFATARRGELRQTADAQFTMTRSRQTQLRAPAAGVVTKLYLSEDQALPTLKPLLEVDGAAVYGIASAPPSTGTSSRATPATTSRRSRPPWRGRATTPAAPTATSAARPRPLWRTGRRPRGST
jgi:hypothetical protein